MAANRRLRGQGGGDHAGEPCQFLDRRTIDTTVFRVITPAIIHTAAETEPSPFDDAALGELSQLHRHAGHEACRIGIAGIDFPCSSLPKIGSTVASASDSLMSPLFPAASRCNRTGFNSPSKNLYPAMGTSLSVRHRQNVRPDTVSNRVLSYSRACLFLHSKLHMACCLMASSSVGWSWVQPRDGRPKTRIDMRTRLMVRNMFRSPSL